jgi:hypothetical protein
MSQVQLEAFFLVQNACAAFPSTLVSMLELSPPLPILLLLRVAGLSGLNTIIVCSAVSYEFKYCVFTTVKIIRYHGNTSIVRGKGLKIIVFWDVTSYGVVDK